MDTEKAFDSLDHNFLIFISEKYGFGKNFILRLKISLRDQESGVIDGSTTTESCVIDGSTTAKFFSLGTGARHCGSVSAFLFILALEILFFLIKLKPEIEGLTIFDYNYLFYSVYADDVTFFLKDTISIKHMVDTFYFFGFFQIKTKVNKIAGIEF